MPQVLDSTLQVGTQSKAEVASENLHQIPTTSKWVVNRPTAEKRDMGCSNIPRVSKKRAPPSHQRCRTALDSVIEITADVPKHQIFQAASLQAPSTENRENLQPNSQIIKLDSKQKQMLKRNMSVARKVNQRLKELSQAKLAGSGISDNRKGTTIALN